MTPTLRSTLIWVGVVCVLGTAVLGWMAWWYSPPAVDQAQARAVQPAIDAYLHQNGDQLGFGGVLDSRLKPEVFCDVTIIGIRTHGPHWQVGMALSCGQYARRGSTLLEASGGSPDLAVADVITSGPGARPRVLSLALCPEAYPDYVTWVHQNFSAHAAAWLLSDGTQPTAPDPAGQARQAFGFPTGYPVVQD